MNLIAEAHAVTRTNLAGNGWLDRGGCASGYDTRCQRRAGERSGMRLKGTQR